MDILRATLCEYSLLILFFGLMSLAAFIITLLIHNKRKTRYLLWKKETINLGIYRTEKEFGKDEFMEELYTENLRLETENKLLKKQVSNTKFFAIVIFIIILFAMWLRRHKNEDTNGTLNGVERNQTIFPIEEETKIIET